MQKACVQVACAVLREIVVEKDQKSVQIFPVFLKVVSVGLN